LSISVHPLSEMTPRVPVGDDDYMRKYPHDEYGDEMGDNARVWKAFIDERDIADKEYIEDNNATLDGILVFVSQATLSPMFSTHWDQGINLFSYPNYLRHADISGSFARPSRSFVVLAR